MVGPLIEYPSPAYAIAAALIFAGLIFYIPFALVSNPLNINVHLQADKITNFKWCLIIFYDKFNSYLKKVEIKNKYINKYNKVQSKIEL